MKKINQFIIAGLLLSALGTGIFSCTKLEDTAIDKITDGSTVPPEQSLASAYGRMYVYPTSRDAHALNEHSTDEMQGPTRGTDWDDNGVWRQIHEHSWTPTHDHVVTSWDDFNKGHALANEVLNNPKSSASVKAQATFVRAFFIFQIMDLFGQVPFKDDKGTLTVLSRAQAFDKVVADLDGSIANLAGAGATPSQAMVATKEAAQAFLAKLYLNRGVYTVGVSAAPTFAAGDMDKVIAYCDAVINTGKFALSANYFDNWAVDNDTKSKELVFNFPYTAGVNPNPNKDSYGSNQRMVYPGLHYNQNPSGWNGFTTLSDFYNSFETGDKRLGGTVINPAKSGLTTGFLVGQQKGLGGVNLTTRQGDPLIFTPACPLNGAIEAQGIRVIKMMPDFDNSISGANDFGYIRYADVLLMKAEALFRKGTPAPALIIINQVRIARGLPVVTAVTDASLLAERGHEFYDEGWRRNDLIRFGKFNNPVINRTTASAATKRLFPIPQKEIEINALLKQNEGY